MYFYYNQHTRKGITKSIDRESKFNVTAVFQKNNFFFVVMFRLIKTFNFNSSKHMTSTYYGFEKDPDHLKNGVG